MVNLLHVAGLVSSATLGFVADNLPGAIGASSAFKLADEKFNLTGLAEHMPRMVKRKRSGKSSSSGSKTRGNTPRKQKRLRKTKRMKKKSLFKKRRGATIDSKSLHLMQDMSLVRFTMKGRKPQKHTFDGRIKFKDTYSHVIEGPLGLQSVMALRYFHHRNQLVVDTPDNSIKNDRSKSSTNVFALDPNRATTGSGTPGNPGSEIPVQINPASEAIYCSHHTSRISLTSLENIPQHVEMFWCVAKIDSNLEPTQAWADDQFTLAMGQSPIIQATTAAGAPDPASGYPSINTYGERPSSKLKFSKMWKIVCHREFVLPVGMTVRFEFSRPVHKLIRRGAITPENHQKGLTFVPFIVIKPAPVLAKITSELNSTQVMNYGPTRIGYMQEDTGYYHVQKQRSLPYNRTFSSNWQATLDVVSAETMELDGDMTGVKQVDIARPVGHNSS